MLEKYLSQVKSRCTSIRKQWSNRLLEGYLSEIVATFESHKKRNVSAGDRRYQILWEQADRRIQQFCNEFGVEREKIEAQAPVLQDLKRYSEAPEPTRFYFSKLGIVFAVPVSIFVAGVASGAIQHVFHWGYHLTAGH